MSFALSSNSLGWSGELLLSREDGGVLLGEQAALLVLIHEPAEGRKAEDL